MVKTFWLFGLKIWISLISCVLRNVYILIPKLQSAWSDLLSIASLNAFFLHPRESPRGLMSRFTEFSTSFKINLIIIYKLYNKQSPQSVIWHLFSLSKRLLGILSLNYAKSIHFFSFVFFSFFIRTFFIRTFRLRITKILRTFFEHTQTERQLRTTLLFCYFFVSSIN